MIELIQDVGFFERILTIEKVPVVGLLLTIIGVMMWEIRDTRKRMKDKEDKIERIINQHLADLKENNKDMFEVYKLYTNLANEIKEIVRGHK